MYKKIVIVILAFNILFSMENPLSISSEPKIDIPIISNQDIPFALESKELVELVEKLINTKKITFDDRSLAQLKEIRDAQSSEEHKENLEFSLKHILIKLNYLIDRNFSISFFSESFINKEIENRYKKQLPEVNVKEYILVIKNKIQKILTLNSLKLDAENKENLELSSFKKLSQKEFSAAKEIISKYNIASNIVCFLIQDVINNSIHYLSSHKESLEAANFILLLKKMLEECHADSDRVLLMPVHENTINLNLLHNLCLSLSEKIYLLFRVFNCSFKYLPLNEKKLYHKNVLEKIKSSSVLFRISKIADETENYCKKTSEIQKKYFISYKVRTHNYLINEYKFYEKKYPLSIKFIDTALSFSFISTGLLVNANYNMLKYYETDGKEGYVSYHFGYLVNAFSKILSSGLPFLGSKDSFSPNHNVSPIIRSIQMGHKRENLFDEKQGFLADKEDPNNKNKRNDDINMYYLSRTPSFVKLGYSIVASLALVKGIAKLDKYIGIQKKYEGAKNFMGKWFSGELDLSQDSEAKPKHSPFLLTHPMFNYLRQSGKLNWFFDVLYAIKNPNMPGLNSSPRVIMLSGPSGCGKTTIVKAFAQTIAEEGLPVIFKEIDPKIFTVGKDQQGMSGMEKTDAYEYLQILINSPEKGIIVLYLDEYHLYFGGDDDKIDFNRLNGFLKLFADVKTKQNKLGSVYGVYIILSTNKPYLIPHEIFDNPDRIADIIEIDIPNYNERIEIIQTHLLSLGIPYKNIDIKNISNILSGMDASQAKIIQVLSAAITSARMDGKIVNTNYIYQSIDKIIKRIDKNELKLIPSVVESCSAYFAPQIFLSKIINKYYEFENGTVYQILERMNPMSIKNLYKRPEIINPRFGKVFFLEDTVYENVISSYDKLEIKALLLLIGSEYCKIKNIPLINQAIEDEKLAYKLAAKYYESKLPEELILDCIHMDTIKRIDNFILSCKMKLSKLLLNEDMNRIILEIKKLLFDKKIIYKEDVAHLFNFDTITYREELLS